MVCLSFFCLGSCNAILLCINAFSKKMNMKRLIIFCLVCISLTNIYTQNLFRYVDSERHYFNVSPNKVVVKFNENITESAVESSFRNNASLQVSDISAIDYKEFKLVHFYDNTRNSISQLANQLISNDAVLFVGYVIVDETGRKTAALTNQVNVRLKSNDDFPILLEAIADYDIIEVKEPDRWDDSRTYRLIVNCFSGESALQIANELHETGLFEWASPNLILFIRYASGDPHFHRQWGLINPVYGIRAWQAWTITTGVPYIKIAVLDTGVDLNHPDLINKFT